MISKRKAATSEDVLPKSRAEPITPWTGYLPIIIDYSGWHNLLPGSSPLESPQDITRTEGLSRQKSGEAE